MTENECFDGKLHKIPLTSLEAECDSDDDRDESDAGDNDGDYKGWVSEHVLW